MPYIDTQRRKELDPLIERLSDELRVLGDTDNMGDYNYVISKLIHNSIRKDGLRYRHLNNIVGMMECCKAEFLRTVVSPYEDKKAHENCAVSELDANSMGWPCWYDNSGDKKFEPGQHSDI